MGPSHPIDHHNEFNQICQCPYNNELVNKCVL